MDFSRSRNCLFSFAVSAMLTSAFLATAPDSFIAASAGPQPMAILNAVRAEGWHGAEGLDLPAPSAAPEAARPEAEDQFDTSLPAHEVGDEVDFVVSEARRLRALYPRITVAPMIYRVENDHICAVRESGGV